MNNKGIFLTLAALKQPEIAIGASCDLFQVVHIRRSFSKNAEVCMTALSHSFACACISSSRMRQWLQFCCKWPDAGTIIQW